MSKRQDDARTWVRSVIGKHLPRTARKYKLAVYTGQATVSTVLGVQIDLNPAEGKVIELTDAGAWQYPVAYVDPLPEDIIATPPSVKFRVCTAKADGWLEYRYDRAMDVFGLSLTDTDGNNIMQAEGVHFDDLTGITVDWIDDGTWRIAKVEILAPARRRATAA